MVLRLHSFLPRSRANGPGWRAVLWTQGCSLGCPGCFNPHTHPVTGGESATVDDLFARVQAVAPEIEGVTLSGGEPLQQRAAVLALMERVRRETALSVILFTGFSREEVQAMSEADRLLACVDVLIAGRYREQERLAAGLRGSANKTVHFFTRRYSFANIEATLEAEVVLRPDGQLILSGIDPVRGWG